MWVFRIVAPVDPTIKEQLDSLVPVKLSCIAEAIFSIERSILALLLIHSKLYVLVCVIIVSLRRIQIRSLARAIIEGRREYVASTMSNLRKQRISSREAKNRKQSAGDDDDGGGGGAATGRIVWFLFMLNSAALYSLSYFNSVGR